MFLDSACSCLRTINWSQLFSGEWRCSWSSADRRCSNYIWVINNFIAYSSASYIRDLTVVCFNSLATGRCAAALVCSTVTIHRCIAILTLRYISIQQTQCIMIHMKLYAQAFLKRINQNIYFFLIRLIEILWYNSAKSGFGSTSGSCSSRHSIH